MWSSLNRSSRSSASLGDLAAPASRHRNRNGPAHSFSPRLTGGAEAACSRCTVMPGQRLGQLEGADHAQAGDLVRRRCRRHRLAVEVPRAGVGLVEPGEQVEERGLAGAVRSDQRGDPVALDLEVFDVDGEEAAERGGSPSATRIGSCFGMPRVVPRLGGRRRLSGHRRPALACHRRCPAAGRRPARPARGRRRCSSRCRSCCCRRSSPGCSSLRVACSSTLSTNWMHEEEDHRADDRALHAAEPAEDDDREREERQRRWRTRRSAPTASGRDRPEPADRSDHAAEHEALHLEGEDVLAEAPVRRPRPRGCCLSTRPHGLRISAQMKTEISDDERPADSIMNRR